MRRLDVYTIEQPVAGFKGEEGCRFRVLVVVIVQAVSFFVIEAASSEFARVSLRVVDLFSRAVLHAGSLYACRCACWISIRVPFCMFALYTCAILLSGSLSEYHTSCWPRSRQPLYIIAVYSHTLHVAYLLKAHFSTSFTSLCLPSLLRSEDRKPS